MFNTRDLLLGAVQLAFWLWIFKALFTFVAQKDVKTESLLKGGSVLLELAKLGSGMALLLILFIVIWYMYQHFIISAFSAYAPIYDSPLVKPLSVLCYGVSVTLWIAFLIVGVIVMLRRKG